MTNRLSSKNAVGLAMLAWSWATAGCADHVKGEVVTCPCDRGICCSSGVCADDEGACEAATQALSNTSVGRWTGYVENFKFASGSDALDLTLHVEADGSLAGELVLGQGLPPEPPTDGTMGWPVGFKPRFNDVPPTEGFAYHLVNVQWTALRLRFDVNFSQPWAPWCQLQTSYDQLAFESALEGFDPTGLPPRWGCSPSTGSAGSDGHCFQNFSPDRYAEQVVVVDCAWQILCGGTLAPCACTAQGCDAATQPTISFDIALRGDEGDGSTTYPSNGGHNVRLIRASH